MQRNQWPLRYKASDVVSACKRQEDELREQALDLKVEANQAIQSSPEYCSACGQSKHDDGLLRKRGSSDPLAQARNAEKKADEYAKWAQALATRGEDTLALHFDDAEYFGLLVEEAEGMALSGAAKGEKALVRRRESGLSGVSA